MGFPLSGFSKIHRILYNDRITVYRYTDVLNEDGTTDKVKKAVPEITDVPCRLSFTRISDRMYDISNERIPVTYEPTVFCPPGVGIIAGDELVVSRKNDDGTTARVYSGNAEDPKWYPSHCEIKFRIDEHK